MDIMECWQKLMKMMKNYIPNFQVKIIQFLYYLKIQDKIAIKNYLKNEHPKWYTIL